ncbi:hypothetical protein MY04_2607 [Flammeovirga sp. MY04]|uniref:hypothetical protein n=1 Tax=Flammeovirga sp. MY04 TaxID=1191459 RepID=UPI00080607F5|nr:hypothetical protein [Flammeovirga sp. MY04]ANQ49976.1 hypothetical protein MY04_2607 [Flammeovirga sp. MY04]
MKFLLQILLLLIVSFCFAQKSSPTKTKFGKISDKEWNLTIYDKDPNADKVILHDVGVVNFRVFSGYGVVELKRNKRIKYLKESSLSDNIFQFLLPKSIQDDGLHLKANVFSKVGKKEIKNDVEIKELQSNSHYQLIEVSIPSVKVGDIVDIEYKSYSDSYAYPITPWYFQNDVPTLLSELTFNHDERDDYTYYQNYQYPLELVYEGRVERKEMVQARRSNNNMNKNFGGTNYRATATVQTSKWLLTKTWRLTDIPAFKEEDFVLNDNFKKPYIFFDLVSISNMPLTATSGAQVAYVSNGTINKYHSYSDSWNAVSSRLKNDIPLGGNLFSNITDDLKKKSITNVEKASTLYAEVQKHYNWNGGQATSISEEYIKKGYKTGVSNVAGINISLYKALKDMGFDVNLMYTSMKGNGVLVKPTYFLLDYVIVNLNLEGKSYYLDATQKTYGLKTIPINLLNKYFLVVSKNDGLNNKVFRLESKEYYYVRNVLEFTVDDELNAQGNQTISFKGYANLKDDESVDFVKLSQKGKNSLIEKSNDKVNYDVEIDNFILKDSLGYYLDLGQINYTLKPVFKKNEQRKYEVEFQTRQSYKDIIQITLPKEYSIENTKAPIKINLKNNGGTFSYSISQMGNVITIMMNCKFNQYVYLLSDYKNLTMFSSEIQKLANNKLRLKTLM